MSHIASVKCQIKDLTALRKAAEELGAVWVEGQTSAPFTT